LEENVKEGSDFTAGFLDESVGIFHFRHMLNYNILLSPSDIVPLNYSYKKMREILRRMPSYRGEVPTNHPIFPEGSAAVCGEALGPVDLDAPDIIYTTEDDQAIDKFIRDTGMSNMARHLLRQNTKSISNSTNDLALGM